MRSALVVSKEKEVFHVIPSCFGSETRVSEVSTREAALDTLKKKRHDFILFDIEILLEGAEGDGYKKALEPFWRLYPTIEIIVMSPHRMIREAVKAVKAGASDYIIYPIDPEELRYVTENIQESIMVQSELDYLRDQFWEAEWLETIHTKSALMKKVYERTRSVAPTISTVLITGETGTGKGVLANLIHRHSNRRDARFISVHCGAIPDTLLESELFGHEKGAFTGAVRRKLGKFEIAGGGTIFLDEIGTITPSAQIKLLQVLQDGTFQRVGGEETLNADVRAIVATNVDLKEMCEEGRFRKDLYYRFNVFPIHIPPLREHVEDIPFLVEAFLKKMSRIIEKGISHIDSHVVEAFKRYSWPGNIRELENLIERAYILETASLLTPQSFPADLFETESDLAKSPVDSSLSIAEARQKAVEDFEKNYIKDLLSKKKGRIKDSAEAAGITSRQFNKIMAKYGIRKKDDK